MKSLATFILFLLSNLALADTRIIRERDMTTAALVSTAIIIQCNCTATTDANGNPSLAIGTVLLRWTSGTTNYCSRTPSYNFFLQLVGIKRSMHEAVLAAKGDIWSWEIGASMPLEADPWCSQ